MYLFRLANKKTNLRANPQHFGAASCLSCPALCQPQGDARGLPARLRRNEPLAPASKGERERQTERGRGARQSLCSPPPGPPPLPITPAPASSSSSSSSSLLPPPFARSRISSPGEMSSPPGRPISGEHRVGDGAEDEPFPPFPPFPPRPPQQEPPPPVPMATASTGGMASSHFYDYSSSKTTEMGNGSFYTSLISDDLYTSPQDSSYFTGNLSKGRSYVSASDSTEGFLTQDGNPFESRGLFSSDSGIEMTPAESTDVNKTFADPMEQMKSEAYKYMDMSRSEEIKCQERYGTGLGDVGPPGLMEKWQENVTEPKGTASGGKYATKEPSLGEKSTFGGYQYSPLAGAPVKISVTETETIEAKRKATEKQDTGLKPGNEVVPMVMVSEPEDESPGSITPPSSATEPSGSESQGKGSMSEDDFISAVREAKGFSSESPEGQRSPNVASGKQDPKIKMPERPPGGPPLDNEVSSAESGDSEIELVSEDPLAAEEVLHSNYMSFSHGGGPPPSPASPSIQYSILREEREAELDSELIIESCDASSASEESPKREHDSPLMKPIIMDIIQEENYSRNESVGASNYKVSSLKESRMNKENLADSASYLKCSFGASKVHGHPSSSLAIGTEEIKDRVSQKKSTEVTSAVTASKPPSKGSLTRSLWSAPPLPFLNKQKAIDLLYWRDIKQTGIVFGSVLLLLFSLTQFSVVSVIAYLALAALSATISFRIYKSVLQAVQKTDEGHPFKSYLEMEMSLSQEQIQKYTDCLQSYMNCTVKELRRLFLVQDLVDSLKFAVLMWLLTYVGALFNGLTLLIMAVVSMFSLPVVYDKYQAQIDQYLGLVRTHINTVVAKIQAKIPGAKRKAE
nr:PREDICTED: reticulon-1 isoform X1 [Anolis carolinensis]|eukprot:XP_003224768.3 PREDICTED: reticulon-1 isoform X1 [Anolis carolinensis]